MIALIYDFSYILVKRPQRELRGETSGVNSSSKLSRREVGGVELVQASGGRRERQRLKTRAKITRAARTLFARKGFDATTTQEIAAKADIGTGTLFNYAKTKEDLLLLVFREEMDVVVERAFATIPSKGSLLDQLLHVFDAFVAYHQRDVEIAHALIRQLSSVNAPETRDDIIVFMRALVARISELIQDAQTRGELRGHLPRGILAHNLFSIYYRLLQEWLGEYITYEQYMARIRPALELQLIGLRPSQA
jgi:AcrR family transcriptional regulator